MSAPDANGWMPIATVPKMEAVLIAGGGILYPIVASWSGRSDENWWVDAQADCVDELFAVPTHWQPLPSPPVQS